MTTIKKPSYKTGRMQKVKNNLFTLVLLLATIVLNAQDTVKKSGFDSTMRSNGRIYVVVAVMTTILLGLFIYLARLDKKISRIEKQN